jgi:hypothetical protein
MNCQIRNLPPNEIVTSGNLGTKFPSSLCPLQEAVDICPLTLQEGEEYILELETGDFLIMPCDAVFNL